jgi:prepilin peptidase CpaA
MEGENVNAHPELIAFVAIYDFAVLAALGFLLWACVTDFMTMTIPNQVSIGLIVSFAVAFIVAKMIGLPAFSDWKTHAAALGAMFVLTFIMFLLKVWGAGDSKLASAVALWIGLKGFVTFLLVMSFAGVGLVLGSIILSKARLSYTGFEETSWPRRLKAGGKTIPYGIAIAFGAIWTFFTLGYLDLYRLINGML